ncbi:MAG: tetratricopeptide repeat protein [Chitinophagaceae bacterium]|nr:tetratricopeptide repeat protein [Chitinophagaceae bacterium]
MMLAHGSLISGQVDKGIAHLDTVYSLQPDNVEATLMLADIHERQKKNQEAIRWYKISLEQIKRPDVRADIEKKN